MSAVIGPHRQHPAAMLRHTLRYLLLLTLPFLRALRYTGAPQNLSPWIRGIWIDLTAVGLLFLFVYLQWKRHTYRLTPDGLYLQQGVVLLRSHRIPYHHVATITVERPIYLRILRAARIVIVTDVTLRSEVALTLSERHANAMLAACQPNERTQRRCYRPHWYHVVVLSLLASNSLSGVVLLITVLYRSSRLFGGHYGQELLNNLEAAADYIRIIPNTIAVLVLILLCGWGIAVVRSLLFHLPFSVTRDEQAFTVYSGKILRRDHLFDVRSVNFIDLQQTLVCKLLRLHFVFVQCVGHGKERDALFLLVPACSRAHSARATGTLLPEFHRAAVTIRPAPYSLLRYIRYPIVILALVHPTATVLSRLFPIWAEAVGHLLSIVYIPLVWLLILNVIDRYTGGIGIENGCITLRYRSKLTLHTVFFPTDRIVSFRFRQSFFQRRRNLCDVCIYTHSKGTYCHRIKNVRADDINVLFE
ncbi:MAG: PH domain-containing protein [Clostridia bacterium]|nr:PH domain-containing protein [Clostridia bacterium]